MNPSKPDEDRLTVIPEGLGPAGTELFRSIADEYELNPGELRLLHDAASEADVIADMERAWREAGSPMTTNGSRNQLVAHPILSELRQHRTTLRALIGSLSLEPYPDEDNADDAANDGSVIPLNRPMSRSDSARIAAAARWNRNG